MVSSSSPDRLSLTGKRALVTGASSGFGLHFARVLAQAGASVVIAARRTDRLEELATELRGKGTNVLAVVLDVRSRESVKSCFDAIEKSGPVCDVIVNNAGISLTTPFLDLTEEEWANVAGTNLDGAWRVAHEGANRLKKAGKPGSIINIASATGIRSAGGIAPWVSSACLGTRRDERGRLLSTEPRSLFLSSRYAAAKAGLIHLTHVMALELARFNIRTNALAPGWFSTELNDEWLKSKQGDNLRLRIPSRRFGEVEELDGPLLLLASDASSYMNGSVIVVGGYLATSGTAERWHGKDLKFSYPLFIQTVDIFRVLCNKKTT